MSQESDRAAGGLPDSLAEFSRIYDSGARDRVADSAAALDYESNDGDCRYTDETRILAVRDATDIVLGYSVSHSIAGGEEMDVDGRDEPDGYETALEMLDAAWDPDAGHGEVTVHLPDDTATLLCRTIPANDHDIRQYVTELQSLATEFRVDGYRYGRGPTSGTGKTSAEHHAANVAATDIDGTPVIATYNRRIGKDVEDMGAVPAAPWQILAGIRLSEGPYTTPELNRVANVLDRFRDAPDYRDDVEHVPESLRGDLDGLPDTVVPDHSVTTEIAERRRRFGPDDVPVQTWQESLRAIDAAVAADDVDVLLPENTGRRMEDTVGGEPGAAVREDIERVTGSLPVDLDRELPDEMGAVPDDERRVAAEDYAIAVAAIERSAEPPLILTYDDDFAGMDGVVAREPGTVLPD